MLLCLLPLGWGWIRARGASSSNLHGCGTLEAAEFAALSSTWHHRVAPGITCSTLWHRGVWLHVAELPVAFACNGQPECIAPLHLLPHILRCTWSGGDGISWFNGGVEQRS